MESVISGLHVPGLGFVDFAGNTVAALNMGAILGRKPYTGADVEVAGFIADRGSTGRARNQDG